jgi:hypothetical protein
LEVEKIKKTLEIKCRKIVTDLERVGCFFASVTSSITEVQRRRRGWMPFMPNLLE